jgi:hypothetical protein
VHDPEKWIPVFRKDHAPLKAMHDPEKWIPVFRKDHAPLKALACARFIFFTGRARRGFAMEMHGYRHGAWLSFLRDRL